jgi:hypothetical protein
MSARVGLPRSVPRAVVLVAIVLGVALVGGIWKANAQSSSGGVCMDAAPLSESAAQPFLGAQGPNGHSPCGVFSVCSHGSKSIAVQDYPSCAGAGQNLTVYCMNGQGAWTNAAVSNVSVAADGSTVTFVVSQHGTCGLFPDGTTARPGCGDSVCQAGETPVSCPSDCWAVCGDGYITHGEQCESDANCAAGQYCNSCQCTPTPTGYTGTVTVTTEEGETVVMPVCGDGIVMTTLGEECESHDQCGASEKCQGCLCVDLAPGEKREDLEENIEDDETCGNDRCDPWEGDGVCDCDCDVCGDGVCDRACEHPWCTADCD